MIEQGEPPFATRANMERYADRRPIAYSPTTGEVYSADPGDYFWMDQGDMLTDSKGDPMYLVIRETRYVPVSEVDA